MQWCIDKEYPKLPAKEDDKAVQFWQYRKQNGKVSERSTFLADHAYDLLAGFLLQPYAMVLLRVFAVTDRSSQSPRIVLNRHRLSWVVVVRISSKADLCYAADIDREASQV